MFVVAAPAEAPLAAGNFPPPSMELFCVGIITVTSARVASYGVEPGAALSCCEFVKLPLMTTLIAYAARPYRPVLSVTILFAVPVGEELPFTGATGTLPASSNGEPGSLTSQKLAI